MSETESEIRTDTHNANEYTDDELEDAWLHYIQKYVSSDMFGTDLMKLDALEAEMGERGWTILVTEDRQEVDRNGAEGNAPPDNEV